MVAVANETRIDDDAPAATPARGARMVVAGHYEIDPNAPIGAGGMALVYRGLDLRTHREVALKTLRLEYRASAETRARFRREARTMAFLTHPNVARVYDLYEDDEAPWAILEFVPGRSLKDEIAARGPFGVLETSLILDQIGRALDHLHGRGLVHLDIKPQNLIRTPDGVIKLIDFGLAQRRGEPQETIAGTAFGTAAYLSPEQAVGDPVDIATDVYALGCVAYELLTGQPPFEPHGGDELKNDIIRAHLEREPIPPSHVNPALPGWVDDVIGTALAKRPSARYPDCGAFAREYRRGLEDEAGLDDAPAIAPWTPPVVDAVEQERESPATRRHPAGELLYRTGGKIARRTGWLQRLLWRAAAVVLVANLLLAALLYFDRGTIPGIYAGAATLQPGAAARVTAEGLRLRAAPGRNTAVIGAVNSSDQVSVIGNSEPNGGEIWWPVRVVSSTATIEGWVAGGWLEPVNRTGRERLQDWLHRLVDDPGRFRSSLGL